MQLTDRFLQRRRRGTGAIPTITPQSDRVSLGWAFCPLQRWYLELLIQVLLDWWGDGSREMQASPQGCMGVKGFLVKHTYRGIAKILDAPGHGTDLVLLDAKRRYLLATQ